MKVVSNALVTATGLAIALGAAAIALVLWMLPASQTPLRYLIAGTAGTGVWLGAVLAIASRLKAAPRRPR